MQLIAEETADTAAHLFLDVGTQRIPALCAADRIEAVRVLGDLGKLVDHVLAFGAPQMCGSSVAVDPAVFSDLDPLDPFSGIDRRPQGRPAVGANMVFPVLILEEELVGWHRVTAAVLTDLHGHDLVAVRTEEGPQTLVPLHGRVAHITVPGALFGKDRIDALISLLIHGVEPVQLRDAVDDHGIGVREGFSDLPHPFAGDMGGTHDDAKGFVCAASLLGCPQAMQGAESR